MNRFFTVFYLSFLVNIPGMKIWMDWVCLKSEGAAFFPPCTWSGQDSFLLIVVVHSTAASSVTHFLGFDVKYKDWAEQRAIGKITVLPSEIWMAVDVGLRAAFFHLWAHAWLQLRKVFKPTDLQKYPIISGCLKSVAQCIRVWTLDQVSWIWILSLSLSSNVTVTQIT